MDPIIDVDEITRRAQRHWMEDGLSEIMLGLLFVIRHDLNPAIRSRARMTASHEAYPEWCR